VNTAKNNKEFNMKKKQLSISIAVGLFFIVFLFSNCMSFSTYKKPEIRETLTPLMVDNSETVAIRKVLFKIPYGTVVGKVHIGVRTEDIKWETSTLEGEPQFVEGGSKILRNQGYNVLEDSDNLFEDTSSSAKARFQIGGIIKRLFFNGSYTVAFGEQYEEDLEIEIEWQVYDSLKEKVVYKDTNIGQYYGKKRNPEKIEAMIYTAYEQALMNLLADKKLVSVLTGKEIKEEAHSSEYKKLNLNYTINHHGKAIPAKISDFFPAVVTITSGLTHGSGVFITPDGYILTAAHVVSGVDKVVVVLESGKKIEGKVLRINLRSDCALVKVDGKNYSRLHIDFNKSSIGSEVYIIGTPLEKNLSYSVSKGIISGYRSSNSNNLIQTDAAVNPGNSGGPLLNSKGYLIGIVSKKIVGTTVEGVGFGVSIDTIFDALNLNKNQ
jgi:serine protease Do